MTLYLLFFFLTLRSAFAIGIRYVGNAIRIVCAPVSLALSAVLKLIQPGAKFISDLKSRRLIHSECGQAKSPVHAINRQVRSAQPWSSEATNIGTGTIQVVRLRPVCVLVK